MSMHDAGLSFGARLRENRRTKGLSQAELGGERYTGSYISHLESGRRTANREVVEFLAMRLGVTPGELGGEVYLSQTSAEADSVEALAELLVAERAWHDREWGMASLLAGRAAKAAADSGQTVRHWEALYLQAQACAADGRFTEAAELAQRLADLPVAASSRTLRSQALSLASTAYRASDQLAVAITCAAQAVELSADAAPIVLADALMSLVSAMLETGSWSERTEHYCRRLADVALHVESQHAQGVIAWSLGTAAYRRGDSASGRQLHDKAFGLISPSRDLRMWLRLHRVIATCRMEVGETDGVAELLAVARTGLTLLSNQFDLFELVHAEAKLLTLTGRLDEAAALITTTLGDPAFDQVAPTNGRLDELQGSILEQQGRLPEAADAYRRAASIYERQSLYRVANAAWQKALDLSHQVDPRVSVADLTRSSSR